MIGRFLLLNRKVRSDAPVQAMTSDCERADSRHLHSYLKSSILIVRLTVRAVITVTVGGSEKCRQHLNKEWKMADVVLKGNTV
jgi:hypothetical protein